MTTLQLDLFAGKVLTTKQILQADKWVETNNRIEREKCDHFEKIETLFIKYELTDFIKCDYRIEEKTYEKKFNTWSGDYEFAKEVSVVECRGGIKLKYQRFDNKTKMLIDDYCHVWVSDIDFLYEKIQISTITNNYRNYKFSSIKKKIEEYNNSSLSKFNYTNDSIKASNIVKTELENKYPNAVVTEYFADIKEWDKWRNVRCVKITFKSVSYVEYKVFTNASKAILRSKDMQKETVEQMIERFNLQEKES